MDGAASTRCRTTGNRGGSSLKLENESFDAFLRALDEPIPAETKELMRREPQWA